MFIRKERLKTHQLGKSKVLVPKLRGNFLDPRFIFASDEVTSDQSRLY